MDIKEYTKLKERVESFKEQASRLEGKLQQLQEQLEQEFACTSLEGAQSLLERLVEEACELEIELEGQTKSLRMDFAEFFS